MKQALAHSLYSSVIICVDHMNRQARLRVALIVFAVAVLAGTVLLPPLLEWRAGVAFSRINKGDAASKVALFMGVPTSTALCGAELHWDQDSLGPNGGRCATEQHFKARHGRRVVGYSPDGHVVSKYFDTTP
jgi:hypothetical protein